MFDCIKLKNINDYFKTLNQRESKGVYFYRIIGYNNEILKFIYNYRMTAFNKGAYINQSLNNPTEEEVLNFYSLAGVDFFMDKKYINDSAKKLLNNIDEKKINLLSSALYEILQYMNEQNFNQNILRNSYVKFMCWFYYKFKNLINNLGEDDIPKILYEGEITKYELYLLKIFSMAGCDVIYFNFLNENSYLKIDSDSKFTFPIYGDKNEIPKSYSFDFEAAKQLNNLCENIKSVENIIYTNEWIKEDFFKYITKSNSERNSNLKNGKIYNIFVQYLGIDDKSLYNNRLYNLIIELSQSNKLFTIIDKKITNPFPEEISKIEKKEYETQKDIINNLALYIKISDSQKLNSIAQKAFIETLSQEEFTNPNIFYNLSVKLLCWLNRYGIKLYQKVNFEIIPTLIYYGSSTKIEGIFLCMLSKLPMDIIYICSDINAENGLKNLKQASNSIVVKLENSEPVFPYPHSEVRIRVATTAYEAERDLDKLIYTDTGMFRNKQFSRSKPVTLKTTYEEIEILWKEEAKYRPSFSVENGYVTVPNIFAKICGVNEDIGKYKKTVKSMVTEDTIVLNKFPYITENTENTIKPYVNELYSNKRINPNKITKHREYKYEYLNEDTQSYILEKIQDLIDLNWIYSSSQNLEYTIISTLLNLDKKTLRLIQQFDFTRQIPKLLIFHCDESVFSIEDCIYIAFLNLIGFDIAVFTPTGYRNIEKYITKDVFESYTIGEFIFDINISNLKSSQEAGIINKLLSRVRS